MPRLLIIEDDKNIAEAIEKSLSLGHNFALKHICDAAAALPAAISYKPDLILLDIRLPTGDGRVILKSLKDNAATRAIPVIFLTGLASEGDKVLGLNLGADDYLAKPFGAMELLARVQAVLRRYQPDPKEQNQIEHGGLRLDLQNRTAAFHEKPLALQPREFEILYLLASHPGRTLSRSYLIENSSSYGMEVASRSLDTHIKNIRKKLGAGAGMIETWPKLGYRFTPPS